MGRGLSAEVLNQKLCPNQGWIRAEGLLTRGFEGLGIRVLGFRDCGLKLSGS